MNHKLKKLIRTILFLGTGIVILYLVYHKQNLAYQAECAIQGIPSADCSLWRKIYQDFIQSNGWVLISVLFLFMLSNLSRAIRWNMLLRQLGIQPGLGNSFWSIMLGYFANLGLPRIGELIRAATMARYEKTRMDKVMGTVIVDRSIDVVMISGVMILAMALASTQLAGFIRQNSALREKISGVLVSPVFYGSLLLMAFLVILFFRSNRLRHSAFGTKIRTFLSGMLQGFKTIASLEKPVWFVLHSLFIWLMYYLMLYVGFMAFQPTAHLGPVAGLVVFTMGSLGIVIPSPGGMGTYHFLVTAGLMMYGVSGTDGFSFANILFFTIQIFGNILFGLLALVVLPWINRTKETDEDNKQVYL